MKHITEKNFTDCSVSVLVCVCVCTKIPQEIGNVHSSVHAPETNESPLLYPIGHNYLHNSNRVPGEKLCFNKNYKFLTVLTHLHFLHYELICINNNFGFQNAN